MSGPDVLAGRYELGGVLGRGGMAEVREAFDTLLHRPVAVKMLHPGLDDTADNRRRFEQEARSAAGLEHPNIVAVHDFGEHDGSPFIVMERLPGDTVADELARGPMPVAQVRSMLDDVLGALSVAHRAGVLHRDVKPGNILVSATRDSVKVGDFGIAKTADCAATRTGQIIGTMCYMSPERLAGAPASVADDLYAVGVIGYEAVLGRRAFPQDNPAAVAHAILHAPPPPLGVCRTDIDPVLAGVIDRAMARVPEQRFGSAEQMRAALAGRLPVAARPQTRVLPMPVPPPTAYPGPAAAARRDTRRPLLVLAAIASVFLVAGLALALQPFSSPEPIRPIGTSTAVPPPSTTPPPPPPVVQPVESAPAAPPAERKPDKPKKNNGNDDKGPGKGRGD
ncbi:serine/threonine protein kinase [Mycolicibacterium duvalii]|nr:serine/threonine-protein kinase [Mycolicibacterium duvalii]MCV7368304.1 serine/threonine protein kinase [Mycolicibacterium duvalii]PEG35344.1 serine/threonine protein kinase [Mycolicibacterium duvalii]